MRRLLLLLLLLIHPAGLGLAATPFAVRLPLAEGAAFAITYGYGPARARVPLDRRWLVGFAVAPQTGVVATGDGQVVEAGLLADGTAQVVLHHPDGHYSFYMSLPPGGLAVHEGQRLHSGERLGSADRVLHYALVVRFPDGHSAAEPLVFRNGAPSAPVTIIPTEGVSGVVRYTESTPTPTPTPAPAPGPRPLDPPATDAPPLPDAAAQARAVRVSVTGPVDVPGAWTMPEQLTQDFAVRAAGTFARPLAARMAVALPGLIMAIALGIVAVGALYWLTCWQKRRSFAKLQGNYHYRQLLQRCAHDAVMAGRLLDYECKREPSLPLERAARLALDRWDRDPRVG